MTRVISRNHQKQLTVSKSSSSSSFTSFSEEEEEQQLTLRWTVDGINSKLDQNCWEVQQLQRARGGGHETYWWSGPLGPSCSPPCRVHPGRPGSCTLGRHRHQLPLRKQTVSRTVNNNDNKTFRNLFEWKQKCNRNVQIEELIVYRFDVNLMSECCSADPFEWADR